MKKISVLQINADNFGAGGISTIIWRLIEHNRDKDILFSFLSQKDTVDDNYIKKVKERGGDVYFVHIGRNRLLRYYTRYKETYRLLMNNRFDIVHINGNESFGIVSYVVAARKAKCKIVIHGHSTRFMNSGMIVIKMFLRELFIPLINRYCDGKLACSSQAAEFMFGRDNNANIVKNGLDYEKYRFNKHTAEKLLVGRKHGKKVIVGHIGRFVYAKNHEFLLEVFEVFHIKHPHSRLWLIGEDMGEGYERIKSIVKAQGIEDSVDFIGKTDKIQDYLSAMDVLVFPSRFEGLPLVMVEAQANGVPIVCSDRITEEAIFANNVSRLPLECGAIKWAEGIENLLGKRIDNPEEDLKINGFDINNSASIVMDLYREIVG